VYEGLPPREAGKQISEHRARAEEQDSAAESAGRDRLITIAEALRLAVVAVLAAWSCPRVLDAAGLGWGWPDDRPAHPLRPAGYATRARRIANALAAALP
jgi:hypothetical protein